MYEFSNDKKGLFVKAVEGTKNYLLTNPGIEALVCGVSGGIDSAVTIATARQAIKELGSNIKLIGLILPIAGNKSDEIVRAEAVAAAYCDESVKIILDDAFESILKYVDTELFAAYKAGQELTIDDKIRMGNIKARTRMITIYNDARKRNGLVLSTDNYTEYLLGFWTLHGDVGDFGPIQNLWKNEVYGMAEAIGGPIMDCVDATPTDGLGITNSDIDQLLPEFVGDHRAAYLAVDEMLYRYIFGKDESLKDTSVIKRYEGTHFKRNNPTNLSRELFE